LTAPSLLVLPGPINFSDENLSTTGKAVIEGESVFGKTVNSLTYNDEFDDGTSEWESQGSWNVGDDSGDYYVSISTWNSYVSQMDLGVIIGKTYKLEITYDIGIRTL